MSACGCRNHLGGPKQQYYSRDAAIDAILDRHIQHGPHEIYDCPVLPGVLHVKSKARLDLKRRTA